MTAVAYLPARYDPALVVASVLIASLASYVALDLAKRVRAADRRVALTWWAGGSPAIRCAARCAAAAWAWAVRG